MLYKNKSNWNTLSKSEESKEIARLLGVNEAKILRIGNDTSDKDEMDHMDLTFVNCIIKEKKKEIFVCSYNHEIFIKEIKEDVVAYYIINDGIDWELTLDMLKAMEPGVFAKGEIENLQMVYT